jgi:hypothetical protein
MHDELKLIFYLDNFKKGRDDGNDHDQKMEAYKALLNKNIINIQESLNKL